MTKQREHRPPADNTAPRCGEINADERSVKVISPTSYQSFPLPTGFDDVDTGTDTGGKSTKSKLVSKASVTSKSSNMAQTAASFKDVQGSLRVRRKQSATVWKDENSNMHHETSRQDLDNVPHIPMSHEVLDNAVEKDENNNFQDIPSPPWQSQPVAPTPAKRANQRTGLSGDDGLVRGLELLQASEGEVQSSQQCTRGELKAQSDDNDNDTGKIITSNPKGSRFYPVSSPEETISNRSLKPWQCRLDKYCNLVEDRVDSGHFEAAKAGTFWKQGSQVDQQFALQRSELNGLSKLQDVKATTESTLNESHTPEDGQQSEVYRREQATEDRLWKPKAVQQGPLHYDLEQHTSVHSPSPLAIKVILLGDYGIGKIHFLEALSQGTSQERGGVRCTDYRQKEFVELTTCSRGRGVRVKIMNTAGQERFRSVTSSYYRDVQGCLLMFSVTQKESFDHVMHWYSELQRYTHTASDRLLLLGLSDTSQSRDRREVTSERAFKMAEGLGTRYLETTMADTEMLLWIVQQITDAISQQVVPVTKPRQIITISPPSGKQQPRRKKLCAS